MTEIKRWGRGTTTSRPRDVMKDLKRYDLNTRSNPNDALAWQGQGPLCAKGL